MKKFSHLDKNNQPKIVDVSNKNISKRTATAQAIIKFKKKSFNEIKKLKNKKGNIINVATIAGIMGSKKTAELIPLCHNINLEDVTVEITTITKENSLKILCYAKSSSKTGVEMEALVGVSIASLTIYDMCKSLDKNIFIQEIKLLEKSGGKSGKFSSK